MNNILSGSFRCNRKTIIASAFSNRISINTFPKMKLYQHTFRKLSLGAILLDQHAGWVSSFVPTSMLLHKCGSVTGNSNLNNNGWFQQPTTKTPSSTTSRAMSTESSNTESKKDQSFLTWSFDEPCPRMDWNNPTDVQLTIQSDPSDVEGADLVILGLLAPPKPAAKDNEDDDNNKDEVVEPMELTGIAKTIDTNLNGAFADFLTENAKVFKNGGKLGSMTPTLRVIKTAQGEGESTKSKRYICMGLGSELGKDGVTATDWTGSGFAIGKAIASKVNDEKKIQSVSVTLPAVVGSNATLMTDLVTAFYENLYVDNRYRTGANIKKPIEDLKSVTFYVESSSGADIETAVEMGKKVATGVYLAKDIVNSPHNVLNSESLAETAKRVAEESNGLITCTILDKTECEKRGMGAYLGVARGSETAPQFIHLTYKPPSGASTKKKLGIVGKGLLFDTGGYNIKTSMMEMMKFDCGGAAAVIGAARALAALRLETDAEVHFIVPACENMINEKAMVPSDILTASNGKTIEVMNTDAEGRLTLADALVYADKEINCTDIIELSTLTGACMVALGKSICGMWTSNDALAAQLQQASTVTGDKVWRMPLANEYKDNLKSTFADIKNVGGRYGGSITAALFLNEFVSSKKPFAHIDIAGPVWDDKSGATGFGVKLILEWIKVVTKPSDESKA